MPIIKFSQKTNFFLKNNSQFNNLVNKAYSERNTIYFSKLELTFILNIYSKHVSLGLWRDYAIDSKTDIALFSIFRHTHDKPIYQIIKYSQKGHRDNPDFFIKDTNRII